jgi:transcriptional regulator of acetoin/glycerol metabolism
VIAMRANDLIAGPDAGRRERVRAVQAVAACSDPVVFFTDVSDEVLRADMLDGVRRLLTAPTADAAGPPEADPAGAAVRPADPAAAALAHGSPPDAAPGGGAAARRRRPGRPPALGREQVEAARRMHAAGTHSVDAIAATLGVSRATVYRHLDRQ